MRRTLAAAVGAVLVVVAGCGPGADETGPAASSPPTEVDPAATWQAMLDDQRAEMGAPGALVAVDVDGVEWSGASGAADVSGAALAADARFRIGSVTKPVLALLALDAVAQGQVALDEPVAARLDALPVDPEVSLRMLLAHTSGIFAVGDEGDLAADIGALRDPALRAEAEAMAAEFLAGEPVLPSVRLLVALAGTHPRYAPPGDGYHYSNVNYLLVGALLEQVSGRPLGELLQARIAERLGLSSTTLEPPLAGTDLVGYARSADGELTDPGYAHLLLLGNGGAGGVVSTAQELLAILQAAVAGDLLPAPLVEEMLRPTTQSGGQAYGLGLASYSLSCGTFHGHQGGIAGVASIGLVSPDGADGVVLAVNARGEEEAELPALADAYLCG